PASNPCCGELLRPRRGDWNLSCIRLGICRRGRRFVPDRLAADCRRRLRELGAETALGDHSECSVELLPLAQREIDVRAVYPGLGQFAHLPGKGSIMTIRKVTIAGAGNVGSALAKNLLRHGVDVQLAASDLAQARDAAAARGERARAVELATLRAGVDALFLAVPADAAPAVLDTAR